MTSANRTRCARLAVEALEQRHAPAGNVTATFTEPGFLEITGDGLCNDIRIVGDPTGTSVEITSGDGTTINDAASVVFPTAHGIRVDLGDGDDRVWLSNFNDLVQIRISTGNGDDVIAIRDVVLPHGSLADLFEQAFVIDSGNGNDLIDIGNLVVFADHPHEALHIDAGNGDDHVRLGGEEMDFWFADQIHNFLFVDLGNGDDSLEIESGANIFAGWVDLMGGNGYDGFFGTAGLNYAFALNVDFEELIP